MEESEITAPRGAEESPSTEEPAVTAQEAAPSGGEATPEQLLAGQAPAPAAGANDGLRALIEAIVYVTEEPVTAAQIAAALGQPVEQIQEALNQLAADYASPAHGLMIREIATGYKMTTKAEHHEGIRTFAKSLKPALKLSLAALETLATIAYKQPVTGPEIMEIRGVQGAGVLKTLLDRKLIATSGRKNVVGRPILYRTTKDFLVQFGLKDLSELPSLKEFEELRRLALNEGESGPAEEAAVTPMREGSADEASTVEAPAPEPPPVPEENA